MILARINQKIKKLKAKSKPSFTRHLLSYPDVLAYLGTLYRKYAIVPLEKGGNNFTFICKNFYIPKVFSEMTKYNKIHSNSTFSKTNFSKDDIIKKS